MKKDNTKRKGINVIDLAFVILLVAVVLFVAFGLFGCNNEGGEKASSGNVTVMFESKNNDPSILGYIEEGQSVYDGVTQSKLGTIVAVHESDAQKIVENHENKTIEISEIPEKVDITLEIQSDATIGDIDIVAGSVSLKVGTSLDCIAGDAVVKGTIVGLTMDETNPLKEVTSK